VSDGDGVGFATKQPSNQEREVLTSVCEPLESAGLTLTDIAPQWLTPSLSEQTHTRNGKPDLTPPEAE
jgi:hypothetical protein